MNRQKSRRRYVSLCYHLVMSNSVTPWTVALQAPLSMEFSRQEYWSRQPSTSLGDLPNPGIEPQYPTLQADSLSSEPTIVDTKYGETDIENRLMDMGRGEEQMRCMERITWKLTLSYVKQTATGICCMAQETQTGLCISLEGWDGEGEGREVQKGGDICIPMTD